jgi:outer membrane protein
MATATWPLFEGMVTPARVREARANALGVVAQRDAIKLSVRLDLERARLGIQSALAQLEAADEALKNAEERLSLAEGRYAAGVGTIIELGDAQLAETAAAAQRVQAAYALATARAQLLAALGRVD